MRTISVARFGGPEVLAAIEAPDPVAGPGELVVAASASDVMFVDTVIRSGRGVGFFIPNLDGWKASAAGAGGGLLAGLLFLFASRYGGPLLPS